VVSTKLVDRRSPSTGLSSLELAKHGGGAVLSMLGHFSDEKNQSCLATDAYTERPQVEPQKCVDRGNEAAGAYFAPRPLSLSSAILPTRGAFMCLSGSGVDCPRLSDSYKDARSVAGNPSFSLLAARPQWLASLRLSRSAPASSRLVSRPIRTPGRTCIPAVAVAGSAMSSSIRLRRSVLL
jgi:hypothetical protein